MNGKSITEKTFEDTLEVQEAVALLHRMIGRAEAFNAMENISRVARLKMLKTIRDNKLYKGIPGCSTMRDVFEKLGVSKTTGYLELEALERLGENLMELLDELGATREEKLQLGRGVSSEVEEMEFEVIDPDQGKYRIDGRLVKMDRDREIITGTIQKALATLRQQKLVNNGLEKKLEESGTENKRLRRKIETGEIEFARLQKKLHSPKLQVASDIAIALMELVDFVKQIDAMPMTEDDEKARSRYMTLINNMVIARLVNKFNPKGEDVGKWVEHMESRNEYSDHDIS